MTRYTIAVLALLATGCPDSHGADDGGVDAQTPVRDGSISDAVVPGSDAGPDAMVPRDAGHEPMRCEPTDQCYCFAEDPRRRDSYCITPWGEEVEPCDVGNGCSEPGWLCNDLGNGELEGEPTLLFGVCSHLGLCDWQRRNGSRAWCYYEDGTLYETGELATDSCDDDAGLGVLCGPGCGDCPSGRTCVGVSEHSGIGLCVRGTAADSPDRCGLLHDDCAGGQGCLGFVVPEGVGYAEPESVWHRCVPSDACDDLERRYPDRFVCRR